MASTDPIRRAIEQERDRAARHRDSAHADVERYSLHLQEAIEAAAHHGREVAALDAFLAELPAPDPEPCAMAPYESAIAASRRHLVATMTVGKLTADDFFARR